MSDSVGKIALDMEVNKTEFNKQVNSIADNATNVVGGAFTKLGAIIAGAFAVQKLFDFGKASIELASNLNEVQNVVDVTFGGMSTEINRFSKNALQQFGISELSAKKFASTMGAMLKSSGLTGNDVVKMSEGITGLSADMASFYNLSSQDAFDKIRSGISGMTEPLKQLGINMDVANLSEYALSQGIRTHYKDMDQATQSLLRYHYLMSVTKDAQGDFARTSNAWANQTRLLTEQWKIFQTVMGQGFINTLTPLLVGLNAVIQKLQIAAEYFRAFTVAVFGSQNVTSAMVPTTNAATSATDASAKSSAAAAKATGGLGKAVKGTNAAITKSLGAFDQLNVLGQKAAAGLGAAAGGLGAGGAGDVGSTPAVPLPDTKGLEDKMKSMGESIKASLTNLFKPFKDSWDLYGPTVVKNFKIIMEDIKGAVIAVGVTLSHIWNDPNTQASIRILCGIFSDLFTIFRRILDEIIKPILQNFLDLLDPTKNKAAHGFLGVIKDILTGVKGLTSYMAGDGFKYIKDFLNLFMAFKATQFVYQLALSTFALVANSGAWVANTVTMGINTFQRAGAFIASVVNSVRSIYANIAALVSEAIVMNGATVGQYALNLAMSLNPIVKVVTLMLSLIAVGVLVYRNWNTIASAASSAFGSMRNIIGSICSDIGYFFRNMVNGAIGGINVLIKAINSIKLPSMTIPGLGTIGGQSLNIPYIPRLANGGLVSSPTLAMVGDNKGASTDPEVISPLSKLKSIMGNSGNNADMLTVLTKILEVLSKPQKEAVFKIGETEFARASVKAINNLQRQVGNTLLYT